MLSDSQAARQYMRSRVLRCLPEDLKGSGGEDCQNIFSKHRSIADPKLVSSGACHWLNLKVKWPLVLCTTQKRFVEGTEIKLNSFRASFTS